MRTKILAIDFDGTLSLGAYPGCGPANQKLIDKLVPLMCPKLEDRNFCFVLWSSRTNDDLAYAVAWCKARGLIFDGVNELPPGISSFGDDNRKLYADVYIDDHAITPDAFCEIADLFKSGVSR